MIDTEILNNFLEATGTTLYWHENEPGEKRDIVRLAVGGVFLEIGLYDVSDNEAYRHPYDGSYSRYWGFIRNYDSRSPEPPKHGETYWDDGGYGVHSNYETTADSLAYLLYRLFEIYLQQHAEYQRKLESATCLTREKYRMHMQNAINMEAINNI